MAPPSESVPLGEVIAAPPAAATPSGAHTQPSGAHTFDQSSALSATGPVFQMPREGRSAAKSGAAGFLGVLLAVALVALGATGYYVFTHSDVIPPIPTPGEPASDGVVATPLDVVEAPATPAAPITPVRLTCNVQGARLRRDGTDLGDCGAPLLVPPGESWEIDISAPGYVARRVVVFSGQGDVPVSLTRRGGGARVVGPEPGDPAPPVHRGGDVRNPWDSP